MELIGCKTVPFKIKTVPARFNLQFLKVQAVAELQSNQDLADLHMRSAGGKIAPEQFKTVQVQFKTQQRANSEKYSIAGSVKYFVPRLSLTEG